MKERWAALQRSWPAAVAGCAVLTGAIVMSWVNVFPIGRAPFFGDIESYRRTLDRVVAGDLMYTWLGYPPFALIPLSPLRGLPVLAGYQLWTGMSIVLVLAIAAGLVKLTEPPSEPRSGIWPRRVLLFSIAGSMLLMSLPVVFQLACGQLTLVVMFLAFIDAAGVIKRRRQGMLVGVAAGLKLTPLFFIPYYAITKQWRTFGLAIATFGATVAIGFALFPVDSAYFWTHTDSSARLEPARADNFSLLGTLNRWLEDPALARQIWMVLAIGVGLTAYWRAREHFRLGEQAQAALLLGCASTVVSPVAWAHYDIWLVVTSIWMLFTGGRFARIAGLAIYFVYSLAYSSLLESLSQSQLVVRIAWEAMVLVPVLVAVLGLPHHSPPAGGSHPNSQSSPGGATTLAPSTTGSTSP